MINVNDIEIVTRKKKRSFYVIITTKIHKHGAVAKKNCSARGGVVFTHNNIKVPVFFNVVEYVRIGFCVSAFFSNEKLTKRQPWLYRVRYIEAVN